MSRSYSPGAVVSDKPRKTKTAPLSAFSSSPLNLPTRCPSRFRGTAVSLSTISRQGDRSPVRAFDGTGSLKIGADVGSVVRGQTTIESFPSKRSSWTMTAGRGLPTYAAPPATVQISPRLTRHPTRRSRQRMPGRREPEDFWSQRPTGDEPRERMPSNARPRPRLARGAGPASAGGRGGRGPCHERSSEWWWAWASQASGYM